MPKSSETAKEVYEAAKDAIEVGAFKMARIFTARLREISYEATTDKEITEITKMMANIRSRMK